MLTTGAQRPHGLSPLSSRVFEVLEGFVLAPWSILKVECGWHGIDPLSLDEGLLEQVIPRLGRAVARMTDREHGLAAEQALRQLLWPQAAPPSPASNAYDVGALVDFDY
jgi:hypothetical protein